MQLGFDRNKQESFCIMALAVGTSCFSQVALHQGMVGLPAIMLQENSGKAYDWRILQGPLACMPCIGGAATLMPCSQFSGGRKSRWMKTRTLLRATSCCSRTMTTCAVPSTPESTNRNALRCHHRQALSCGECLRLEAEDAESGHQSLVCGANWLHNARESMRTKKQTRRLRWPCNNTCAVPGWAGFEARSSRARRQPSPRL